MRTVQPSLHLGRDLRLQPASDRAGVARAQSPGPLQYRPDDHDRHHRESAGRPGIWKVRWGLIPPWHKGTIKQAVPHINARIEGVDTNGLFKRAYVKNRCIIPASGFYEWTGDEKNKTPHFISAKDGAILAFAGIWERWRDESGEEIISASIITRDANDWMSKIHTRMPAMLHPDDFQAWLDGSAGKEILMRPPPELQEWVADRRMNKTGVGDDDPVTAAPLEEVPQPPQGVDQGELF